MIERMGVGSGNSFLNLKTDQGYNLRVRSSQIAAVVVNVAQTKADSWYKVYVIGCPNAFLITEESAAEACKAQERLT